MGCIGVLVPNLFLAVAQLIISDKCPGDVALSITVFYFKNTIKLFVDCALCDDVPRILLHIKRHDILYTIKRLYHSGQTEG